MNERVWQWQTPAHVYVVGYETLRSDFTSNPQSPPRRTTWDVVVLDEAQKIKNRDVEISSKCKQLLRRRAWALTGTPLENKVEDLCSILEFVAPLTQAERPQRLAWNDDTRNRHRRLQLRRRKSDVLPQLPPKVTSKIMLTLEGAQRESYDRAEKEGVMELRQKGETVRIQNVLELITRLKQICNFCPASRQSAKLSDVRERLVTLRAQNHRALIFSQFTDERFGVRAIAVAIKDEQPLIFTGDLGPNRDAIIKQFKEDETRRVLILSLRAGGQGLNLQEASYVFHFDRWWNPAIENQADARSHRMGQQHPVTVYKYVCEGTIEERIDQLLADKQTIFDDLIDDVSIDLRSSLSGEQLFGLFGLKPPEASTRPGTGEGAVDFSSMTGVEFETHVQRLLEKRGWALETTPASRDGGIDLIARRTDDVGLTIALYIQCKNHSTPVTVEIVRELNGVLPRSPGARGVVTCPSGFTADAKRFAQQNDIVLWDRAALFDLRSRDTA